ncbi:MAG TPA: UDP-N-acetylmuramoyl-L-alanyl-D-glutamate--2,6-diaminopimelate ligase [Candidatus Ozemobacteraceae bacterium]|nr:UDP-N-acetylmuramoyl-L-alanyl-D-glutamate--2,6-diaminopimelate ligase [Candidatus Ozemobacteraceae bacterium]
MKSFQMLLSTPPLERSGNLDVPITGVAFDSRRVEPGFLFVAMPGSTNDGARFITDAIQRGAAAIVTQDALEGITVPAVRVADARRTLSSIARAFHDDPSKRLQLIGITGTKGKTTTTYFIQSILRAEFGQAFRFGTVEYDLGFDIRPARNTTPESLDLSALLSEALAHEIRAGVMEVSSHALKTSRVEDLTFSAAGFSNLSLEHTEFHPDMEDYFRAKRRLFLDLLPPDREAVIGIDDDWGRRLAHECRAAGRKVRTISVRNEADIKAINIKLSGMHTEFEIAVEGRTFPCRLALAGEFNVFNALMAAGLSRAIGIGWETIIRGLTALTSVPGRFESIPNHRDLTVIVDYAHSPAALENLLIAVRPLAVKGRVISVFGCGGNRSTEKRPIMGRLSATLADITVVTSDNPRKEKPEEIIAQIFAGIEAVPASERREVHVEADRRKAIAKAIELARPGDVLLIAGKGHETGQTFADRTLPFDDRLVAKELLEGAKA